MNELKFEIMKLKNICDLQISLFRSNNISGGYEKEINQLKDISKELEYLLISIIVDEINELKPIEMRF